MTFTIYPHDGCRRLPARDTLPQILYGTDDKEGEQRGGYDVDGQALDIEERETFHEKEEGSEDERGSRGIAHVAAPLHGAGRGDETVVAAVGRREDIEQARRDKAEERHAGGTDAKGVAEDIDDNAHGKAPEHINPPRSVAVEHQYKIDERHGGGITEDVDVVADHHLQQQHHGGEEKVL